MLMCLSSGSRPRYKQDVIRALAMPISSELQFRYDTELVSDSVLRMIEDGTIIGEDVLIAYADQTIPNGDVAPTGPFEMVPVRLAKLASASLPGRTVSLIFSLEDVVYASNLQAFNNDVDNLTGGSLPRWVSGMREGLLCTQLTNRPTTFVQADDLRQWEEVVTQLADRKDFSDEETFITVLGLLSKRDVQAMSATLRHLPWPKELTADDHRDLTIYHYHPSRAPSTLAVSVDIGPQLGLESNRVSTLDSRYDIRRFRIRSGDPPLGTQASWVRLTVEAPKAGGPLDFEMKIRVKGNWLTRLGIATMIALGISGAQMVPLATRVDLSAAEQWATGVGVFAVSLVAGIAAAWGIRRSI